MGTAGLHACVGKIPSERFLFLGAPDPGWPSARAQDGRLGIQVVVTRSVSAEGFFGAGSLRRLIATQEPETGLSMLELSSLKLQNSPANIGRLVPTQVRTLHHMSLLGWLVSFPRELTKAKIRSNGCSNSFRVLVLVILAKCVGSRCDACEVRTFRLASKPLR